MVWKKAREVLASMVECHPELQHSAQADRDMEVNSLFRKAPATVRHGLRKCSDKPPRAQTALGERESYAAFTHSIF
jgi:hypothetical protein